MIDWTIKSLQYNSQNVLIQMSPHGKRYVYLMLLICVDIDFVFVIGCGFTS